MVVSELERPRVFPVRGGWKSDDRRCARRIVDVSVGISVNGEISGLYHRNATRGDSVDVRRTCVPGDGVLEVWRKTRHCRDVDAFGANDVGEEVVRYAQRRDVARHRGELFDPRRVLDEGTVLADVVVVAVEGDLAAVPSEGIMQRACAVVPFVKLGVVHGDGNRIVDVRRRDFNELRLPA